MVKRTVTLHTRLPRHWTLVRKDQKRNVKVSSDIILPDSLLPGNRNSWHQTLSCPRVRGWYWLDQSHYIVNQISCSPILGGTRSKQSRFLFPRRAACQSMILPSGSRPAGWENRALAVLNNAMSTGPRARWWVSSSAEKRATRHHGTPCSLRQTSGPRLHRYRCCVVCPSSTPPSGRGQVHPGLSV